MLWEEGHPQTTWYDWEAFCTDFSPFVIEQVIDRQAWTSLDWFLPLARGAAIASPELLKRIGYQANKQRPCGWRGRKSSSRVQKFIGPNGYMLVRRLGKVYWSVERVPHGPISGDVLVHPFGSTPILTRTAEAAMALNNYCRANGPPANLRWVKAKPNNSALTALGCVMRAMPRL
jgi:hypothetical protein